MVDWDAELKKLVEGKVPKAEIREPSELRLEVAESFTDEDIIRCIASRIRLVLMKQQVHEMTFTVGPVLNGIFEERGMNILPYVSLTLGCTVLFDADSHTLLIKFAEV